MRPFLLMFPDATALKPSGDGPEMADALQIDGDEL